MPKAAAVVCGAFAPTPPVLPSRMRAADTDIRLLDPIGRKLDGPKYPPGYSWTTLLYPLQGLETDVRWILLFPAPHPAQPPRLTPWGSWDEWVPEARLLKLNESGFIKRKQLLEQQTKKNRPGATAGTSTSATGKDKGKGKKASAAEARKRARDSGVESVRPPHFFGTFGIMPFFSYVPGPR